MENRPSWLDFAKIRLSWGQNGNERIGSFAYTSMMSQGKNAVINGKVYTGMLPSGYANADLKWRPPNRPTWVLTYVSSTVH